MADNNEHEHTSVKDALRAATKVQRAGGANDAILEDMRDEIEAAIDARMSLSALHRVLRGTGDYTGSIKHLRDWLDRQGIRVNAGPSEALRAAYAAKAAAKAQKAGADAPEPAPAPAPEPVQPSSPSRLRPWKSRRLRLIRLQR